MKILLAFFMLFALTGCSLDEEKEVKEPVASETETPESNKEDEDESSKVDEEEAETEDDSEPVEEVITAENNEDFNKMLYVGVDIAFLSSFVDANKGKTIEFDGAIYNIMNHENYNTRFNFLIFAHDYDIDSGGVGPAFRVTNITPANFNFTDESVESVKEGMNIKIKATIVGYNEVQDLLEIKPIETSLR